MVRPVSDLDVCHAISPSVASTEIEMGTVRHADRPPNGVQIDPIAAFIESEGPRLRAALVSSLGHDRGADGYSEALEYLVKHREKVLDARSPIGLLFNVGRSRTRTRRLTASATEAEIVRDTPDLGFEPALDSALMSLSGQQRMCVVLCHGLGWSLAEVASLAGISKGSVQRHLERGLAKLRIRMGVDDEQ